MQLKSAILCLLFVTLVCAGLSAQTGGAMLTTVNGDVLVNGHAAGRSSSVFPGDKIEVPASAAGSINLVGSSVLVSPNSTVQYEANNVKVLHGGTRVSTSQGVTASVEQIVVAPKNSAAKFDVIYHGNHVVVVSREGVLKVDDGERMIDVASGDTIELPLAATAARADAQASEPKAPDYISSNKLSEHPFYGVVSGLDHGVGRYDGCGGCIPFPACKNVSECVRPQISEMRRCCCPNVPPFCDARGNPH